MNHPQIVPRAGRLVTVEDEGILARDLERSLTGAGFDVRGVAIDSEAAFAMVAAEHPDLVLMDIRLHGPRDGIETAAALRERFDVPVVYLTAYSDPKTMARAQQTEPMGYLLARVRARGRGRRRDAHGADRGPVWGEAGGAHRGRAPFAGLASARGAPAGRTERGAGLGLELHPNPLGPGGRGGACAGAAPATHQRAHPAGAGLL